MTRLLTAFVKPPARLRALPDNWARWLRPLWILLFGLSLLTVIVSTLYAVRASYSVQPTIERHGVDFEVTTEGKLVVGTLDSSLPVDSKLIAIDGKRVPPDMVVADLAELLQ